MRKEYHTPWSDEVFLLAYDPTRDNEGYVANPGQTERRLCCTWEDGVSQNEFYLSNKQGHRASASVEIWTVDYQNEEFCRFGTRFYHVLRTFPSSFDCLTLILEEVVR